MYIEDLFIALGKPHIEVKIDDWWTRGFILDINKKIKNEASLSDKQHEHMLKILTQYGHLLITNRVIQKELFQILIDGRLFKNPSYTSINIKREVRCIGGNKIAFRYKLNPVIQEDFKTLFYSKCNSCNLATNSETLLYTFEYESITVVMVTWFNLPSILTLIRKHKFSYDDIFSNFMDDSLRNLNGRTNVIEKDDFMVVKIKDDFFLSTWLTEVLDGCPL